MGRSKLQCSALIDEDQSDTKYEPSDKEEKVVVVKLVLVSLQFLVQCVKSVFEISLFKFSSLPIEEQGNKDRKTQYKAQHDQGKNRT